MVEVIGTDEFELWYTDLDEADAMAVAQRIEVLQLKGLTLGFPHSSEIKTSDMGIRELRVQAGGKALRVFYAFDPRRDAVLLIGGIKAGNDKRFYKEYVPRAEKLWREYLAEQAAGEHDDEGASR